MIQKAIIHNYLRYVRYFVYLIFSILIVINIAWVLGDHGLADFGSFMASGRAAENGLNPYDIHNPLVFHLEFSSIGLLSYFPNMNPPISVLLFNLVSHLDPYFALQSWRLLSFILYIIVIGILIYFYPGYSVLENPERVFWAFSLAGFWHTLDLGQIYIPLLLACVGAWVFVKKDRFVVAGILIGIIIALKPNFIIWPFLLLIVNCWQATISAILSAGFLSIIPLISFGPKIYIEWFSAISQFGGLTFPGNNSVVGLTARFGLPWFGYLLSFLLLGIIVIWVWRNRYSAQYTSAIAIVVTLLCSPISWTGYTILLLPIFFSRKWEPLLTVSAIFLSVPFLIVLFLFQLSSTNFVIFGWLYGWALLLILIVLISEKTPFSLVRIISHK